MFLRQRPCNSDLIINVDYHFESTIGSIETILYERPDGTMYEMISNSVSSKYREVLSDELHPNQKLRYMRENREQLLRDGNALDFAMLVDQLEKTMKIKKEEK